MMTPFHPKLRLALLRDPEHRQRGLTAGKLLEFEGLITRLYYLVHYPPLPVVPKNYSFIPEETLPTQSEVIAAIESFRSELLPNFQRIHQEWVENQQRAIEKHYHETNIVRLVKNSFMLLKDWIRCIFH